MGVQDYAGPQAKKKVRQEEPMEIDEEKGPPSIAHGNIWCPIPQCKNNGCKGYVPTDIHPTSTKDTPNLSTR